jgi:hypothetical protein
MNVIDDMLQDAYPLTHDLLSAKEWKNIVNYFFANHPCQSPQVWYMPKEFYQFIVESKHPLLSKYSFLEELLLFEWTEVEIFMMEDRPVECSSEGDLRFSRLVLNPEHQLFNFSYPVHKKKPKHITLSDKGDYYLIAHRNKSGEVIFTDSSLAYIRLIEYLSEAHLSLNELYLLFEKEYQIVLGKADKENIMEFFKNALQNELIAGFIN